MVAVTETWRLEGGLPWMEVLDITAADGQTYVSRLGAPKKALFYPNRDSQATDSWGASVSGQTVTIHLTGTTSGVAGLLIVVGHP